MTIFMKAEVSEDIQPRNMEPEKCEGWIWQDDLKKMQPPIFSPLEKFMKSRYYRQLEKSLRH